MSAAQDPLVRALGSLSRWQRGRQLVLAAIVGAAVIVIGPRIEVPRPVEETWIVPEPEVWPPPHVPVSPEQVWADAFLDLRRYEDPVLEPRIEKRYGRWLARDVVGVEPMDLGEVTDPASVEPALRDWATRICDPKPRPFYLFGFDRETVDELGPILVDACPSLLVYRVRLVHLPEF